MQAQDLLCTDILRWLTTIYDHLDLILERMKVDRPYTQEDLVFVRNALEITNPLALEIVAHLETLGWKLGVELFTPVVDSLDALSRAANANNTAVFDVDFHPLVRALMDSIIEFKASISDFVVNTMREGMPFPRFAYAGTYLERYVKFVLYDALAFAISCLVRHGITPVPSPTQSSSGSSNSNMGSNGPGPMAF